MLQAKKKHVVDPILNGNVSIEQLREQSSSQKAKTTLIPCFNRPFFFSSEIPEWLQVYAKASPEYDCFLKVTIVHYICEGVYACLLTVTFKEIHCNNHCHLHVSLHAMRAYCPSTH